MSYCEISGGLKRDKFTLHVRPNGSTPRGDNTSRKTKEEQGLMVAVADKFKGSTKSVDGIHQVQVWGLLRGDAKMQISGYFYMA